MDYQENSFIEDVLCGQIQPGMVVVAMRGRKGRVPDLWLSNTRNTESLSEAGKTSNDYGGLKKKKKS